MRRFVAVGAVFVIAAVAVGFLVTTSPIFRGQKACGGFHIVVDNGARSDIEIRINGGDVTSVQPNQTADIAEYGNYSVPAMPWDVQAVRIADGTVLLSIHLTDDGSDGRRVGVEDSPASATAIRGYTCGQA